MEKFEVCTCVVEKMNGIDYILFKDVIRKFSGYADAIKYVEDIKKTVAH